MSGSTKGFDFAAALRLYRNESAGTRAFVHIRRVLAPLATIAAHVPLTGPVLDVGCGHGLFSLALACADPPRRILGVDPSPAKVTVANRVGRQCANAEFRAGSAEAAGAERFAAITILDVLYLLPYEHKVALLTICKEHLAPGGVLLVKTGDTHPRWKCAISRAQERLMTGTGLTLGTGKLHYLSCTENAALLRNVGFAVETYHLRHWSPYPHVLFVAKAG